MKVQPMMDRGAATKLASQVTRLFPPLPHKYSINDKSGFRRVIDTLTRKTLSSRQCTPATWQEALTVPHLQPQYGNFLVNCKMLHAHEPTGSFVFRFLDNHEDKSMITFVCSPAFLCTLFRYPNDTFPQLHRLSNAWYTDYKSDESLEGPLTKIKEAIDNRCLHHYLHPLGILISNTQSTFMNKTRVITHGPAVSQVPIKATTLLIPSEMFIDIDREFSIPETCPLHTSSHICKYYAVLVYLRTGEDTRAELKFISSSRGAHETTSLIYQLYSREIRAHISSLADEDSINRVVFGVMCYLGFSSSEGPAGTETLSFRITPVKYAAISNFNVEPSDWKLLL